MTLDLKYRKINNAITGTINEILQNKRRYSMFGMLVLKNGVFVGHHL